MPEPTGLIGTAASLITALGALPIASLAQARAENRLHTAIGQTCKSIEDVRRAEPANVAEVMPLLEAALLAQTSALNRAVTRRTTEKHRNRPSLAVAIVTAALLLIPVWVIGVPEHWYTWTISAVLGTIAALLVIAGIMAYRTPPKPKMSPP